jgi:hypothetical protein
MTVELIIPLGLPFLTLDRKKADNRNGFSQATLVTFRIFFALQSM